MKTFRFLDFEVYRDAKQFYKLVTAICKNFSREYSSLANQLIRSSLSVVLNIAEGSAKKSDKDFNRYIENALGSINESVASLDVANENGIVLEKDIKITLALAEKIAKQLGGFSKKLKS